MAKAKSFYVCSECGFKTIKWMGKCDGCGEWGTFEEEIEISPIAARSIKSSTNSLVNIQEKVVSFANVQIEKNFRYKTKISEFDRILGGGLVKGEVVLITGNPGIGKSTLLLQTAKEYTEYGDVLYVSGEESPAQIKSRGERLGIYSENLYLMSETDIQSIYEYVITKKPKIVIVDS
ncbi:MAG: ATPase domain-containing protein, partial [Cetobacterium sp.]